MTVNVDAHPLLRGTPYAGYAYGYPHKTAYRPLDDPPGLDAVWSCEDRSSLFLYLHVPFCEQRCGFCNLFTAVQRDPDRPIRYLDAMRRQAERTIAALGDSARFARFAVGGGTPTILPPDELATLFDAVAGVMGVHAGDVPTSVETSPPTATPDRLALLRERGVDRVSIGVQGFDPGMSRRLGRTQDRREAHRALAAIRDAGFPTLNIDLIYGGDGQSADDWLATIDEGLGYRPEEVYLYPLYVRPLTGLGRLDRRWDDQRLGLYRIGRDRLVEAGYRQVSMRLFSRVDGPGGSSDAGPTYCCQRDGMVGLGCGARSYTRGLHYSHEYAVGRPGVLELIDRYIERDAVSFDRVEFGIRLDREERSRRYALMSLLQAVGLDLGGYRDEFGTQALDDLPELGSLAEAGLAEVASNRMTLTAAGLERSDAIGPWLYSPSVRARMESYTWR